MSHLQTSIVVRQKLKGVGRNWDRHFKLGQLGPDDYLRASTKLLLVEDIGPETLRERDPKKLIPPLHGALIKNEQDVHLFERLAFLARGEGR